MYLTYRFVEGKQLISLSPRGNVISLTGTYIYLGEFKYLVQQLIG